MLAGVAEFTFDVASVVLSPNPPPQLLSVNPPPPCEEAVDFLALENSLMRLHVLLALPLLTLIGCGSAPTPYAPTPQYLNLNGNWEAIGLPSLSGPLLTAPIADFTGALQSTNGTVTGTLRAFDASNFLNPCVALTQDLAATGTISTSGNLVLSIPISGGTATLTVTLGSNLQSYAMGTGRSSAAPAPCQPPPWPSHNSPR